MFGELKEVKYFNEIRSPKSLLKAESFKSRGEFRTQASINNGAFLWNNYSRNKRLIIDVRMLYIQGVLQKSVTKFEGQYPTFSFNKNYQIYINITLWWR